MTYLLSSLNRTEERSTAIVDYIRMAFNIDPRDIRYDKIPSIRKTVNAVSDEDRDIIIRENINQLIERLEQSMNIKIELSSLVYQSDHFDVTLTIQEEKLKFRL